MITRIIVGKFLVNCYLYSIDDKCAIIDPGAEAENIRSKIEHFELKPELIICTHTHFDHITAIPKLKSWYPDIKIAVHTKEKKFLSSKALELQRPITAPFGGALYNYTREIEKGIPKPDIILKNGDKIFYDKLKVIHTPGHSAGSICLLNKEENFMFTGDTVFSNGVGRTDFVGGDIAKLKKSIDKNILKLDDYLVCYPGHGENAKILNMRRYISL